MMEIARTLLQCVFDVAVNSMDFASGFLDDEEVEALRSVAASLGVDPMTATPANMRCAKYGAKHEPFQWGDAVRRATCMNCRQTIPEDK